MQEKTLSEEQFVSEWNSQIFIGKISDTNFELKLSKNLYGNFCVFKGTLEEQNCILEIEIDKTWKVILSITFLFPIFGFFLSIFNYGFRNSISLLLPTIMFIIILRFVFIELSFKTISKKGINKLREIIGVIK